MGFVELPDTRIHYQLSGSASLPALVLAHSLGVSMAMWNPQVEALQEHFRFLRYDVRGHGASSVPAGPATAEQLGRDVLGLLDALDIKRASFCGLSMGGTIGQWLGINAAGRLDKLILANTAAKIGNPEGWNTRIAQVVKDGLGDIIPATLERWFTAEFRDRNPETIARTRALLEATNVPGYAACCAAVRDADFRGDVGKITLPTLLIAGSHDPVTTSGDCLWLADNIPGAAFVELHAAHLSNVEAAAEFTSALLSFLAV
jgi:3-oxoadipate enol-lactonase